MVQMVVQQPLVTEDHYDIDFEPRSYPYQVSGHVEISSPDDIHICKPCSNRELSFYCSLPSSLKEHVPKFCAYVQGSSGFLHMSPSSCSTCRSGLHMRNLISHTQRISQRSLSKGTSPEMKRRFEKNRNCIVLSNLSAPFSHPCIADFKLGIRQYGEDANEQKRISQDEKCRLSTSAKLGVRLGGMRYLSRESNEYITIDKYEGRKMNEKELVEKMADFIVESKIIDQVIQQIDGIIESLKSCNGLRLFGVSLLVVYDADDSSDRPSVEVKLVDFANATYPGFMNDSVSYDSPDYGVILGLTTLRKILSDLR